MKKVDIPPATSAVRRLRDIVAKAVSVSPRDISIRKGWAIVLEVEDDIWSICDALVRVHALYEEAVDDIKNYAGVFYDTSAQLLNNVKTALSIANFDAQWASAIQNIDNATLLSLNYMVIEVERNHFNEAPLPMDEVKTLLDAVHKLIDEVNAATDLPADLRAFLIDELMQMQMALLYYKVHGAKGLKQALIHFVGNMAVSGEEFRTRFMNESDKNSTVSKFWGVVSKLSDLCTLAQVAVAGAIPLLDAAKKYTELH